MRRPAGVDQLLLTTANGSCYFFFPENDHSRQNTVPSDITSMDNLTIS
jgi:hypothetical protein